MTTTKSISTFKRYVNWILDTFLKNYTDYEDYKNHDDCTNYNACVVFQASELIFNRVSSFNAMLDIAWNPAEITKWSYILHTPTIKQLIDGGVNINSQHDREYYKIRDLHMNLYQTYELCKIILSDLIYSPSYDIETELPYIRRDEQVENNLHMFAFLFNRLTIDRPNRITEQMLYERAKRLVMSLHNKYNEIGGY